MFQMLMTEGVHAALAIVGGWLAAFAESAAPVAVAALWQGAVIAFFLGLGLRLAFRMSAAQRFAVWAAAFAVIIGLQFLPWFARGAAGAIATNVVHGAAEPTPWLRFPFIQMDDRWAFAIAALWLVASLVRAASLAVHSLRLRRLWSSASPVAVEANLSAVLTAASPTRRFHSRKIAELCTTRKLDRPSVIGFLAPRILIPDWLVERLTPGELEQVVLHEAEHLRRRDDWTNLFQKLALVLFPLNPALMWIESRLCREREMACDEGVVRRTQAPRAYAECLTSLAEHRIEVRLERRRAHALSLGAFERRPELVRRVYSILARKRPLHPLAARALVGVAGCGLLVTSAELARCPQMVAFVPAAKAATLEAQAERGNASFRVAETKSNLPDGHGVLPLTPASSHRAVKPSSELASAPLRQFTLTSETPREVLLKAEMPDAGSDSARQVGNSDVAREAQYGEPQYVVLTTWEAVGTPRRHFGLISDYDTDRNAQPQSADNTDRARGHRVTRITVTRLILAVYRVDPAIDSNPAHVEDSSQPTAPLPESGWLVFKL